MPEPLTALERRILDYLIAYVRENTYQPSIREIGRRFEIKSTKTVSEYLQALADKGWVERDPSRSRGVRLLGIDLGRGTRSVPWYGAIAPEGDALRAEALLGELSLDAQLVPVDGVYILTMRGRSMEPLGMRDRDLLLVAPVSESELADGDVIIARARGAVVIAQLKLEGDRMVLQPANGSFPGAVLSSGEHELLGRVVGTFRSAVVPAEPAVPVASQPGEAGA